MSTPGPWIVSVLGSSSESIETYLTQLCTSSDAIKSAKSGEHNSIIVTSPSGDEALLLKHVPGVDSIDQNSSAMALAVDINSYDKNTDIPKDIQIYKQLLTSETLKRKKILLWFLNTEKILQRVNASQLRTIFPQETFGYGHAQDPAIGLAWGNNLSMGVTSWFGDLFQAVVESKAIVNEWLTYTYSGWNNDPQCDLDWLRKVAEDDTCKPE